MPRFAGKSIRTLPQVAERLLGLGRAARPARSGPCPSELERRRAPRRRSLVLGVVERRGPRRRLSLPLVQRVGERRAQGAPLHLLVDAHLVVARVRAVRDAAARPLRGADRTLPGAAGPLLAPRLASAARDLATGLGRVRAARGSRRRRRAPPGASGARSPWPRTRSGASSRVPTFLPATATHLDLRHQRPASSWRGALTAERTITRPPSGPGNRAPEQQQVALGVGARRPRGSGRSRARCPSGPPSACP